MFHRRGVTPAFVLLAIVLLGTVARIFAGSELRRRQRSDAGARGADVIPRRIIAPVTFASSTLEAAAAAAALAAALHAELVLAGVAPLVGPPAVNDVAALARSAKEQELADRLIAERLDQLSLALPDGLAARTLLTHGPVGAALVSAAREEAADLIVLPSRHETGLAQLFHDHPDRYVLHHSDVAVPAVPTSATD